MGTKKTKWRGIFFQGLAFSFLGSQVPCPAYGAEAKTGDTIDMARIGSHQWIEEKVKTYPELEWLLGEDVEHTQEGASSQQESSWSKNLKGQHYPEFERTMATFVNFYLVLKGGDDAFQQFIASQPPEEALTRENFDLFHAYARKVAGNDQNNLKTIEADLLLGDMGKTPTARRLAKEHSIDERDHDIFLGQCLEKCPQIFPTFLTLSPTIQKELKESAGLIHFGHVAHLEGGPEILKKLKESNLLARNPKAFDLAMLTYMLDVSGARAHETNRGAKSFTNKTFLGINGMKDALYKLSEGSEEEAISAYVAYRASLLGLDPENKEDAVLTRLGAMMRLFTLEEGSALKEAYQNLKDNDQKNAITQTFAPLTIREERTPTYIPAVFVNFIDAAIKQGYSRDKAIQKCIQDAVAKIAAFLQTYREGKANQPYSPDKTLNFNKVAGQVRDNAEAFNTHNLTIDKDWNVTLVQ
jgi:hypothetical protein